MRGRSAKQRLTPPQRVAHRNPNRPHPSHWAHSPRRRQRRAFRSGHYHHPRLRRFRGCGRCRGQDPRLWQLERPDAGHARGDLCQGRAAPDAPPARRPHIYHPQRPHPDAARAQLIARAPRRHPHVHRRGYHRRRRRNPRGLSRRHGHQLSGNPRSQGSRPLPQQQDRQRLCGKAQTARTGRGSSDRRVVHASGGGAGAE